MSDVTKRGELLEWMKFCKEKIDPIDKMWNRRLEDPASENDSDDSREEKVHVIARSPTEEDERQDSIVANILDKVPQRGRGGGVVKKSAAEAAEIRKLINQTNEDDEEKQNEQDK